MEFNGWNSFEDFVRACGYTKCDNNNTTGNNNNDSYAMGCGDIPNGFQCLNPELFVIIGEILGNIVAGNLPYNVQNAVGNWLELVGQAILTYNSQQQYFQGGPGRYFDPKNYNVTNPFCTASSTNSSQNNGPSNNDTNNNNAGKNKEKKSSSDFNTKSSENKDDKIEILELHIAQLAAEIEKIKNKIP